MQTSGSMISKLHTLTKLEIRPEHFAYLSIQKGDVNRFANDPLSWEFAFRAVLEDALRSLLPVLPDQCDSILDIGAGLGTIDLFLYRLYGGKVEKIALLDGENDPPEVVKSDRTFSNHAVSRDYLTLNGLPETVLNYYSPTNLPSSKFNLIMSFASWCFHYEPNTYMDMVLECCTPETLLVVDLRKGSAEWLRQIEAHFNPVGSLKMTPKFERIAFRLK